ncbi:MAG: hypothetical protein ABIA59_08795 [Candidatus Latescibacterota bacterium]
MRGLRIAMVTVSLLLLSSGAFAQVFYPYPAAPVVEENTPVFGPAIGIGDDLFRIIGFARFNISVPMDFGLEIVMDRFDTKEYVDNRLVSDSVWRFGAAGDVKYAFIPPDDTTMPFDLSFNAGFGFESGGDVTNIVVPIGVLISKPVEIAPNRLFTPFAGVYLLILHASVDLGPLGDVSDTDTDVELRTGASVNVTERADMFAALHFGSGTRFYIGLNWRL